MELDKSSILQKAARYWDTVVSTDVRTSWWQSPTIIQHVNGKLDSKQNSICHGAFHDALASMEGAPFKRAVSVGCGEGKKELDLIQKGIVQHFDLYEISPARVERGRKLAEDLGIGGKVRFFLSDAFDQCTESDFDLVYWNNSLHHMLDARMAVQWSHSRLKPDGVFAMNDYVGPSRFQWSDFALEAIAEFRASLPERLLWLPQLGRAASRVVERPTLERMLSTDPTEAADSDNILPAVRENFPGAYIISTGGYIYFTALHNILQNFDEGGEELLMALHLDDLLIKAGENLYAVAFARKILV